MPICVLVLKQDIDQAFVGGTILETTTLLTSYELVNPDPSSIKNASFKQRNIEETKGINSTLLKRSEINEVRLLNPKIAKKERQKTLALWLMPFGFIAGLTFSNMTGLKTFESLGIGGLGELLPGALLGMFSGLIGSFAASGSGNDESKKDLKILRKKNEEGKWLLILETPAGIDLPWDVINKLNPLQIVRLNQL